MSKEHGRVLRARPSLDADEVRRCESEAASREISSQSLMDGSWLLAVARENLELGLSYLNVGFHVLWLRRPSVGHCCVEPTFRRAWCQFQAWTCLFLWKGCWEAKMGACFLCARWACNCQSSRSRVWRIRPTSLRLAKCLESPWCAVHLHWHSRHGRGPGRVLGTWAWLLPRERRGPADSRYQLQGHVSRKSGSGKTRACPEFQRE